MKNCLYVLGTILFNLFFIINNCTAQIIVPDYFQIFKSTDKPFRNMVVKNMGHTPLQVQTMVNESLIDDNGKEYLDATNDLIVAPKRFPLGAGEQKNIRIIIKKPKKDKERFYKITFSPKPLTSEDDFKHFDSNEKSIGIRIVTGMIASVYVEPTEKNINIDVKRNENGVTFANNGNYHTRIFKIFSCNSDVLDKNCTEIEQFITLRPKQKKEIKINRNKYLFYKEKQVVAGEIFDKKIEPFK